MTADDKRMPTRLIVRPSAVDAFLKQARGGSPEKASSEQAVQPSAQQTDPAPKRSSAADVAAFVGKVRSMAPGAGGAGA